MLSSSELTLKEDVIGTILKTFSKDDLIKNNLPNIEFEFRLGTFQKIINTDNYKFIPTQTLSQFKYIIEQLKIRKFNISEDYTLDIRVQNQNERLTIKSLDNIKKFCRTDQLSGILKENLEFITKGDIINKNLNFPQYNLRFGLSSETPLNDTVDFTQNLLDISKFKTYRYKHRYSVIDNHIRFDLTISKTATGQTFCQSKVLETPETYEVELEIIDENVKKKAKENIEILFNDTLINRLHDLLKWSQMSFDIIREDESREILTEYMNIFFPKAQVNYDDLRQYFVGINVLPLKIQDIETIQSNYSVTDKADGDRCLLFVSKKHNGRVYFINNRMNITYSGLQLKDSINIQGTLFDGELIQMKHPIGNFQYLIFDCFCLQLTDIRNLPLLSNEDKITAPVPISITGVTMIKSRYNAIRWFNGLFLDKNYTAPSVNFDISYKTYEFHNKNISIYDLAKIVLTKETNYNRDGIIFTPYNISYPIVGTSSINADGAMNIFKWKDYDQLSIDFLVEIVDSKPSIVPITNQRYIKAKLKVFKHRHNIVDFIPPKSRNQEYDKNFNLINLRIDKSGLPLAKNGDIIYNMSVFEFIYDPKQQTGFNWVPLRFRPDKSDQKNPRPNAWGTAKSNWDLIVNPITYDMITGKSKIDKSLSEYYTSVGAKLGEIVKPMRKYHNLIKSKLIESVTTKIKSGQEKHYVNLLDISCGQGGDINKWISSKINYVLGIDLSAPNIIEAKSRFDNSINKKNITINFIHGDSTQNIINGDAAKTSQSKQELKNIMMSLGGLNAFHIVSCQFAIHYFTKSQEILENVLQNVTDNLMPGGYFIGTTLDGKQVFDKLKTNNKIEGKKPNPKKPNAPPITIWSIEKKYNDDELKNTGQEISVYNVNIGQEINEYLVNFGFLIEIAKKYSLELIEIKSFKDLKDESNKTAIDQMWDSEKEYSFMNNWFIFQKIAPTQTPTQKTPISKIKLSIKKPKPLN